MQAKYRKPSSCLICVCGAALITKDSLKVHIETVLCDDKESLKKHCCDICGHKFRSRDKLRDHVNSHRTTMFDPTNVQTVVKHLQLHSRSFKDHYRQHTGEPFGCCKE